MEDMLVLTRKQNQEILIGDNVKITVLKIKGNTVRLGIEAPRDVNVLRGELPRKESSVESEVPQIAEFTVVFSNSGENPMVSVSTEPRPGQRKTICV
jgi:carbon storage regulator CsrA